MLIRFKEAEAEIDTLTVGLKTFEARTANDDLIGLLIQELDPKIDRLIEAVREIQPTTPKKASVYAMAMILKRNKPGDLLEFTGAGLPSADDVVALVWALPLPEELGANGQSSLTVL
jgi:hypothetical protein